VRAALDLMLTQRSPTGGGDRIFMADDLSELYQK